jgi:response regulator of citrate/malate metabolism
MGLAQIIYPRPTPKGFDEWAWDHYQHHLAIIQQASRVGFTLNQYQIWPVTERNFKDFLQQHQQMHAEMDAIAGVQGSDLQDLDLKDKKKADAWFYLQYVEHQSVAQFLGGGI